MRIGTPTVRIAATYADQWDHKPILLVGLAVLPFAMPETALKRDTNLRSIFDSHGQNQPAE